MQCWVICRYSGKVLNLIDAGKHMKKQLIVTVKSYPAADKKQAVANSALVISSRKLDQVLEQRKKKARTDEEFTEWK